MSKILLLIYFICLLFSCIICNKRKISFIELLVNWLLLIIIVIFRPEEMPDYFNYKSSFVNDNERYEPVFQLIFYFLHLFTRDHFYFIATVGLLTVTLKCLAIIKMSSYQRMSFLVWVSYMLFLQDMIAIRAALAASIFLWAVYYKCNGKHKLMMILLVCAAITHYSALVLLILPLLNNTNNQRSIYLTLLFLSIISAYFGFSLTNLLSFTGIEQYDRMINTYLDAESTNPFKPQSLLHIIICIILWINVNKIIDNKYVLICLKIYTIGCIIFLLCWKIGGVAIRLSELFFITEIILIPMLCECIGKINIKYGRLIPIAIASYVFIFEYNLPNIWVEQF